MPPDVDTVAAEPQHNDVAFFSHIEHELQLRFDVRLERAVFLLCRLVDHQEDLILRITGGNQLLSKRLLISDTVFQPAHVNVIVNAYQHGPAPGHFLWALATRFLVPLREYEDLY